MKKELRAVFIALFAAAVVLTLVFWLSRQEDPVSDQPPDLTIAFGEEEFVAWRGGYEWTWPEGVLTQSVIADAPHPLDVVDDLPSIAASAGDTLVLAFEGVPDKIEVMYCQAGASALTAQPDLWQLSNGNQLILPEDCEGTVWVIHAKWETGVAKGRVEYAFSIP